MGKRREFIDFRLEGNELRWFENKGRPITQHVRRRVGKRIYFLWPLPDQVFNDENNQLCVFLNVGTSYSTRSAYDHTDADGNFPEGINPEIEDFELDPDWVEVDSPFRD